MLGNVVPETVRLGRAGGPNLGAPDLFVGSSAAPVAVVCS